MPADYRLFAKAKDSIDPNSLTYSGSKKVGTFEYHMCQKPDPKVEPTLLDEPEGFIIEADGGAPITLMATKCQQEELKVSPLHPLNWTLLTTQHVPLEQHPLGGI